MTAIAEKPTPQMTRMMQFAEQVRRFDPSTPSAPGQRVALLALAKGLPSGDVIAILAHKVAFCMRVADASAWLDAFEADLKGAEG